ncbi:MAG: amino acid ABC transporter permease [Actinomyces sp.]|jgi:glutamate transport system permease protein|uniref:Amino acid ABC transporter permease n=1 Tax=Schaalia naturae TaxID=635203 RepID=A0ABW2SNA1_9ACTO|nr:amino acid ABC transporter permease [Actinomyces sp.]MCI1642842.1 amino acid ABC transporter permease [Actinomyces sp.]MCI1662463.1 amino acid ABC transporter permease [Actinomyces sp.]MCI1692106.1 amino acid ABC transporter permease [Actinomyces sp.]MCI1788938.1 amino acid ABC transporter permease [Actinomyces sp.]MCI1830028.1 amino acid ABC transporter permease [Actinomyces sp.]
MVLWDYRGEFLDGLGVTLQLTVCAFAGAVVVGTLVAVLRICPVTPLRALGAVFVEVFRNVPVMSLLILVAFALPEIGVMMDLTTSVIVAMTCVGGAFLCEAVRGGVNAVPAGQIEAARSLGFTFSGLLRTVVLPQAFRSMVQPLVTVFIGILISSSLAGVIGVRDLTATVSSINNREALGLTTFLVAAVLYLVIALTAEGVGARLEKRLRILR